MQKRKPWRSRKYLDSAEGQACVRCGAEDGTVVAAHYSGVFSHALGKGGKQKADDYCVADLCALCHSYFDNYADGNGAERAAEFMLYILLTIRKRLDDGVLEVHDRRKCHG